VSGDECVLANWLVSHSFSFRPRLRTFSDVALQVFQWCSLAFEPNSSISWLLRANDTDRSSYQRAACRRGYAEHLLSSNPVPFSMTSTLCRKREVGANCPKRTGFNGLLFPSQGRIVRRCRGFHRKTRRAHCAAVTKMAEIRDDYANYNAGRYTSSRSPQLRRSRYAETKKGKDARPEQRSVTTSKPAI